MMGRTARNRRKKNQDRTQSSAENCGELRRWMVHLSSKSSLFQTFQLIPCHFEGTGRGLKTKRAIKPGEVIVSIPLCLLITPLSVLSSSLGALIKIWKPRFTPQQLLSLFLIIERNKGQSSDWWPFINSLPKDYCLPFSFTQDELDLLPQHILHRLKSYTSRAHSAYSEVFQFCDIHWPGSWVSWDKFCWAWSTLSSRSVFMETEAEARSWLELGFLNENNMALCPYLDLLNHSSTAQVKAGWNAGSSCYEIITYDEYHAHDQVFINYGPHDNVDLFLQYGFTIHNNAHNSVSFSVEDLYQLQEIFGLNCMKQKIDILCKNGLDRGLCCTMDGLSWNLRTALKVLAMDWNCLQNCKRMLAEDSFPVALQTSAEQMAENLIQRSLKELNSLLEKHENNFSVRNHQQDLAYKLIMDDKHILTVALQDIAEWTQPTTDIVKHQDVA